MGRPGLTNRPPVIATARCRKCRMQLTRGGRRRRLGTQVPIDPISVGVNRSRRRLRRDRGPLRRRGRLIGHLLRLRGGGLGPSSRGLGTRRLRLGLGQLLLGCTGGQAQSASRYQQARSPRPAARSRWRTRAWRLLDHCAQPGARALSARKSGKGLLSARTGRMHT